MWPLAHHNNFKIANSPLLFLMSWFRENMVTKPLSKNHVCCKRSLGFFGGCRSEPQQFQRSKNWTVHINSNGCNEQGRASKEALLRTLWKLLFCFFVLFSFFVSVVLRGRRRQNIWAYVILCVAGVARIYVKCCVLVGVAGVAKICVKKISVGARAWQVWQEQCLCGRSGDKAWCLCECTCGRCSDNNMSVCKYANWGRRVEGPPQPPKTQPPWHVFALELEDFGPPLQPASFLSRKHCAKKMRLCCVFCVIRYPNDPVKRHAHELFQCRVNRLLYCTMGHKLTKRSMAVFWRSGMFLTLDQKSNKDLHELIELLIEKRVLFTNTDLKTQCWPLWIWMDRWEHARWQVCWEKNACGSN